ncbi:hypothetical protein LWF15_30685 [Kineosporia rhizophila]|uniref:hypothetical protein n=1 Tax=Kineosporia TaxID=49184 RepID=UPI001E44CA78|nr:MULTISPECIES: hypothetical protein [Kineosporia]MCE0539871.1 hypothetical protein [Kineosporia rhizophila]GLY19746.1 hypothetical protein Kisp01_67600 [Kineosporia sp. NBRC 101677]
MNQFQQDGNEHLKHAEAGIVYVHHGLMQWHQALARPAQLYVAGVFATMAHIETVPITVRPRRSWPLVDHKVQASARTVGHPVRHTYLFAYSTEARQYAETIRPQAEEMGWHIVHADITGARLSIPARPGDDTARRQRIAARLGTAIREQRYGDLQEARRVLADAPDGRLPEAWQWDCEDALSDPVVPIGCLTWRDPASVRLWQHLAATAPAPLNGMAGAVLACALHQSGDRDGAATALQQADAIAQQNAPETVQGETTPGHQQNGPQESRHSDSATPLQRVVRTVQMFIAENIGPFGVDAIVRPSLQQLADMEANLRRDFERG